MNLSPSASLYLNQEMVHERIRTLHLEAEEERLASRVNSVRKARRRMERASRRLSDALSRV
ncbi:hypothetical protein Psi02_18540 [Planotetraspora silvatica]|uniref:Uncharacterized protein n=1 Tax=Planotetraspora silvatica TaxID=234614 RepID=A0A8J3UJ30_9ACTN|nr:hypothetical protein [Planotetraspora silvatica]GII45430.1 hypothetical protein Psi02_18540 [Planotetraspora silvatica]